MSSCLLAGLNASWIFLLADTMRATCSAGSWSVAWHEWQSGVRESEAVGACGEGTQRRQRLTRPFLHPVGLSQAARHPLKQHPHTKPPQQRTLGLVWLMCSSSRFLETAE